jgi:uncharacterized protein YdhG (YjbR/CyaY superfamily)
MNKATTVEEYISNIPDEKREGFLALREIILKNAPTATEGISYGMPAYKLNGMLIYIACHEKHYGIYPMAATIVQFADELKEYTTSKGTIQIPHSAKIPKQLIAAIVKFRVAENAKKVESKKAAKTK